MYNVNPPCKVRSDVSCSWDLKVLLEYFKKLPPNIMLTFQDLAGKLCLLLLICSGCRFCEIRQLRISCIESPRDGNSIIFHLSEPTKTSTWKRLNQKGLQTLTFKRIPGFKYLCPVITLLDYLKLTFNKRKQEDSLFILCNGQPAKRQTITGWAKNHLRKAGLGDKKIASTRSSVASSCVMNNLPLDSIALKIGWFSVGTLVKNYMRPLEGMLDEQASLQKTPTTPSEALVEHWMQLPNRIHKKESNSKANLAKKNQFLALHKRILEKSKRTVRSATQVKAKKKIRQFKQQRKLQPPLDTTYKETTIPDSATSIQPQEIDLQWDSQHIKKINCDIDPEVNMSESTPDRSLTETPLSLGIDEEDMHIWGEEMSFMDPIITDICKEQESISNSIDLPATLSIAPPETPHLLGHQVIAPPETPQPLGHQVIMTARAKETTVPDILSLNCNIDHQHFHTNDTTKMKTLPRHAFNLCEVIAKHNRGEKTEIPPDVIEKAKIWIKEVANRKPGLIAQKSIPKQTLLMHQKTDQLTPPKKLSIQPLTPVKVPSLYPYEGRQRCKDYINHMILAKRPKKNKVGRPRKKVNPPASTITNPTTNQTFDSEFLNTEHTLGGSHTNENKNLLTVNNVPVTIPPAPEIIPIHTCKVTVADPTPTTTPEFQHIENRIISVDLNENSSTNVELVFNQRNQLVDIKKTHNPNEN